MTIKELKTIVKALENDMVCSGSENSEIAFILYDDCDEKIVVDYYFEDSEETIRYTHSFDII